MKLAHVLPILSLIAPIACRQRPETWPPAVPGDEEKYWGTSKYIRPPPGWKPPSEEEKRAREEFILPHRNVVEALEDFMFETTRPKAQYEERLNLGMLSVHVAVARAGDGILTLEGPYVRAMMGWFGEGC
ncbi:hypothetical protein FNYG_01152 [Fusarium nygamai]|uniref:Uncharacterized protein n=1 Tax=Gibberella nygamai TaxID=42673 RepID=A0A2K0WV22_GIBNY|nr:hypothetical protein FNYG_01152 [Fusarium nygamai]